MTLWELTWVLETFLRILTLFVIIWPNKSYFGTNALFQVIFNHFHHFKFSQIIGKQPKISHFASSCGPIKPNVKNYAMIPPYNFPSLLFGSITSSTTLVNTLFIFRIKNPNFTMTISKHGNTLFSWMQLQCLILKHMNHN